MSFFFTQHPFVDYDILKDGVISLTSYIYKYKYEDRNMDPRLLLRPTQLFWVLLFDKKHYQRQGVYWEKTILCLQEEKEMERE